MGAGMIAIEVLTLLVRGSGSLILEVTETFSEEEWTRRALPGTNPPGFTAWHMARTVDWAMQTGVRGRPEVITIHAFNRLMASQSERAAQVRRRWQSPGECREQPSGSTPARSVPRPWNGLG